MKIAIVRGYNLNKWELQSYEPLRFRHELIAYGDARPKFDLSEIEIPVRKLPSDKVEKALYCLHGLEEELQGFDVCFTSDLAYGFSYQAILAKRRYGIKVVCHISETIPFNYENNPMNRGLNVYRDEFRSVVRDEADFFIALSQEAKDALIFEGVKQEKIRVIPWGVDLQRFCPGKALKNVLLDASYIRSDDFVMLYVGRFDWARGVYDLIYALKMLLWDPDIKEVPIRLVFVGKGEEEEGMRWLSERLGIRDNVAFHPPFPYGEIHKLYRTCDVFVYPSIPRRFIREQFGLALVEAMACGVPVVSTLCGSIPEVVGRCGLLIRPNDPSSLYRTLRRLILDSGLRKKMGVKARERTKRRFDAEKVARRIERVFLDVVKG
jgi:glycosyltransferase involved in cell wall biosynthesis